MRGSDVVDVLLEVLPRRWVRVILLALVAVIGLTGWYRPMLWYVADKAAGMEEYWMPVLQDTMTPDLAEPSTP